MKMLLTLNDQMEKVENEEDIALAVPAYTSPTPLVVVGGYIQKILACNPPCYLVNFFINK